LLNPQRSATPCDGQISVSLSQPSDAIDHIGVCVPTFKRPQLLRQLLQALGRQLSDDLFHYSVHVVDNDSAKSAENVVREFAGAVPFLVTYDVEPVQNIALARNRALRSAVGTFVAFIDDDEVPTDLWLLRLYLACRQYNADGVLGPVRPLFEPDAPSWLKKSGLCERASHRSGVVLNYLQTRTGNVLFKRCMLRDVAIPFPPEKGRTGGEDIEFFRARIATGYTFVWCEDAPVFEHVTADRHRRLYYLDKNLRIGGLTGEMLRGPKARRWQVALQSAGALLFHITSATAGLVVGHHLCVRHLVKSAYHIGRIGGCVGVVPVRFRRDG